jgi:nitrogen fixation/metabolism regulation signal transduction histidine kinase
MTSESSGLSFAAVKLVLDAHGGHMRVENIGNDGCVTLVFNSNINQTL